MTFDGKDFSDWMPYFEIAGFENLYLEDSWVSKITKDDMEIRFCLDLILTESHPSYHSPKKDEQYCYKKGKIIFQSIERIFNFSRTKFSSIDVNDEIDFGNIDVFYFRENTYYLEGSWGVIEIISAPPIVVYNDQENSV